MRIISATGMPSRLAISLSWLVACSFLPSSVFSKIANCSSTSAVAATMMARYWLSMNTPPTSMPSVSNSFGSTAGLGPYSTSTMLARKMDAPMVLMMTGNCPRCRNGQYVAPANSTPNTAMTTTATGNATKYGTPRSDASTTIAYAPEHGELALREVDHARRPNQQHEAQRHQRVDGADAQPDEQELRDEVDHAATPESPAAMPVHGGTRFPHSFASIRRSNTILPLVVLDDVVAAQPVAVGVEVVLALRAPDSP